MRIVKARKIRKFFCSDSIFIFSKNLRGYFLRKDFLNCQKKRFSNCQFFQRILETVF